MEPREPQELPEDLQPVADWLRSQRPGVSALDLDRIKQRALAQASGGGRRGAGVSRPQRSLATVLSAFVLTASLGGALAIAGKGPPSSPSSSGSSHASAAKKQYCPPKPPHGNWHWHWDSYHHGQWHGHWHWHGNPNDKCKPKPPKPPKPPPKPPKGH